MGNFTAVQALQLRLAAILATLFTVATLTIVYPEASGAQDASKAQSVTETAPEGEVDSSKPPSDKAKPDPIKNVEEPAGSSTTSSAPENSRQSSCQTVTLKSITLLLEIPGLSSVFTKTSMHGGVTIEMVPP